MEKAEQQQGLEREQAFVRRYDDRLWAYCVGRHRSRWSGSKPPRRVPQGIRHEGEVGWWFPQSWVQDFLDAHGEVRSPPVPRRIRKGDDWTEAA